MPWFINNDTHRVVWNDKKYNTDYMDGIIDPIDDSTECYLVVNNEVSEQGPVIDLWDILEDGNGYIIPIEFYEEGVIEEDVTEESEGEPVEVEVTEPEIYYDDDDKTYPYKLDSDSESPVYVFKSPKDKYGI